MGIESKKQISFIFTYFILWIVWATVHYFLLISYHVFPHTALMDSVINNLIISVYCLCVFVLFQFYLPTKKNTYYLALISIVISILWYFTSEYLLEMNYFRDDRVYINHINSFFQIRVLVSFLLILMTVLVLWMRQFSIEQNHDNKRLNEIIKTQKEAELESLKQQLQPHFLFNSLNSINALTAIEPNKARMMIQQLSDYLRSTLKNKENNLIDLEQEINNIKLYLEIEKVRFGNRLYTELKIDENTFNKKIPHQLLQPLIENAIKYGLYQTLGDVNIKILAKTINNELSVEVSNPFDKDSQSEMKGVGFGLNSLKRRLYLLYNRMDLLNTEIDGNVFKATIKIPQ